LGTGAGTALLAACGGQPAEAPKTEGKPAEGAPAPTQAGKPAEKSVASQGATRKSITMWGREQFLPESNKWLTESAKLAAKKGDFDIKVELFSNDDHDQKEILAMEAKQMPDMSMTVIGALWFQNGWAREVQDLYDDVGRGGGGWFDAPEFFSKMDGKRLGVPLNVEPWMLHLRKDVFDKAGVKVPFASFEEMIEGFKKVTSGNFYGFGGQMTNPDWVGNVLCAMRAHGGKLFDKEGKPTFNTPQNVAGFAAYTDMYTKHKVMPPGVIQWDAAGNNKAWLSGQVAAICNTGSTVLSMRKDNMEMLNNSIFTPWPAAKGGVPTTTADGFLLVVNKNTANFDLCAQVVKEILSKDRYPGNLEAAGSYWFSALKAYKDIDFFTKDPWNKMIQSDVIPHGLPPFADGGRNPILDDVGVASFGDAMQMVAVQGKSPQEAVAFLEQKAKEAEEKFRAKRK
jgi:ABC-type glycerol-3-phosphate transport system substrate-binding protein